eukprot:3153660-Pyramimonas_sp.AAC.1
MLVNRSSPAIGSPWCVRGNSLAHLLRGDERLVNQLRKPARAKRKRSASLKKVNGFKMQIGVEVE